MIVFTLVYKHTYTHILFYRSSCGRVDSVIYSHTRGPGFKTWWVQYTFYQASDWLPPYQHHKVEHSPVCVEGRGRISRLSLTQDIKMGICVFQCDVPYQRIAQRQVGPVSVYCDGVGCHVLCLQHGVPMGQYIGQSTTATSRHRCNMTSDVKATVNTNRQQTNILFVMAICHSNIYNLYDRGGCHAWGRVYSIYSKHLVPHPIWITTLIILHYIGSHLD